MGAKLAFESGSQSASRKDELPGRGKNLVV
jgi:hypothetical protein